MQPEGFLDRILRPLLKTGLPLMKHVLKPLAKNGLLPLAFTGSVAADVGLGVTAQAISHKEMDNILKIVQSLE